MSCRHATGDTFVLKLDHTWTQQINNYPWATNILKSPNVLGALICLLVWCLQHAIPTPWLWERERLAFICRLSVIGAQVRVAPQLCSTPCLGQVAVPHSGCKGWLGASTWLLVSCRHCCEGGQLILLPACQNLHVLNPKLGQKLFFFSWHWTAHASCNQNCKLFIAAVMASAWLHELLQQHPPPRFPETHFLSPDDCHSHASQCHTDTIRNFGWTAADPICTED